MSYAELLSDPRWQRKRLEVMERDEWTCQTCGDMESTLTAHHKSYRMTDGKFADPWDYGDSHLITLCESCHAEEESKLAQLKKMLYFDIRALCDDAEAIYDLVAFIEKLFYINAQKRLCREDFFSLLTVDKSTLRPQLKHYAASLAEYAEDNNDRLDGCIVDCCNFILIEGLGSDL